MMKSCWKFPRKPPRTQSAKSWAERHPGSRASSLKTADLIPVLSIILSYRLGNRCLCGSVSYAGFNNPSLLAGEMSNFFLGTHNLLPFRRHCQAPTLYKIERLISIFLELDSHERLTSTCSRQNWKQTFHFRGY